MRRLYKLGICFACVLASAAGVWYANSWHYQVWRALPPHVTLSSRVLYDAQGYYRQNLYWSESEYWRLFRFMGIKPPPPPPILGNIAGGLPGQSDQSDKHKPACLGEELASLGARNENGKLYNWDGKEIVILVGLPPSASEVEIREWNTKLDELIKEHIVIVVEE